MLNWENILRRAEYSLVQLILTESQKVIKKGAASLQPFPVILVSMEKCLIYHSKSLLAKLFFFFFSKIDFSVALSLPRKLRQHLFILPYFNSGNCFDSTTKSMANSLDVLNIISVALLFLHD